MRRYYRGNSREERRPHAKETMMRREFKGGKTRERKREKEEKRLSKLSKEEPHDRAGRIFQIITGRRSRDNANTSIAPKGRMCGGVRSGRGGGGEGGRLGIPGRNLGAYFHVYSEGASLPDADSGSRVAGMWRPHMGGAQYPPDGEGHPTCTIRCNTPRGIIYRRTNGTKSSRAPRVYLYARFISVRFSRRVILAGRSSFARADLGAIDQELA